MSTIIFVLATAVLCIVVMSKVPGLEHFVKPIIDLLFTFIKFMSSNMLAWGLFFIKMFLNSHVDLLRHLTMPAAAIDPSIAMRDDS